MIKRKKTPANIEAEVLEECARRCALCYHLYGDLEMKSGQVAHLDQNPLNTRKDNLIFMCMLHHSEYDSKTSQHKNFTIVEVKNCRKKLYEAISRNEHHSAKNITTKIHSPYGINNEALQLIKEIADNSISVSTLARKAKTIATKRNDSEILEWLNRELEGYYNTQVQNLPLYRQIYGDAYVKYHFQNWQPVKFHSEEQRKSYTYAPCADPLFFIEEKSGKVIIYNNTSDEQDIKEGLQYKDAVEDIQIRMSSNALRHIVEAVRNRIHDWALTLLD